MTRRERGDWFIIGCERYFLTYLPFLDSTGGYELTKFKMEVKTVEKKLLFIWVRKKKSLVNNNNKVKFMWHFDFTIYIRALMVI